MILQKSYYKTTRNYADAQFKQLILQYSLSTDNEQQRSNKAI